MRCTKAIIYTENLKNNISEIKKNLKPGVKLCCAVKANGYGNDAVNTARTAETMGAAYLAIATVSEGIELRKAGIGTDLLLLSPCCPEEFSDLLENSITPLVFDQEVISALNITASRLKNPEEAAELAKKITETENLELKGMITHFAVSDGISAENKAFTAKQFESFMTAIENVRREGIDPGIRTCAASAAGIAMPEYQLDMIRPGIILYGYYADEVTKEYLESKGIKLNLKPVMQFETEVAAIRRFSPGQSVSYGRTWKADKETDIAVLPVGYADGLLRRNSPGLKVTINGKAYPIVGRICMDQCMADIGKDNPDVKRWDKAIIFGPKEKGSIFDADDIAKMTGTISYEIMTSVSSRVKRIIQK